MWILQLVPCSMLVDQMATCFCPVSTDQMVNCFWYHPRMTEWERTGLR